MVYEFVLRRDGFPDEVAIGDHDGHELGDVLEIRNRSWRVVEVVEGPDALVTARYVLVPADTR